MRPRQTKADEDSADTSPISSVVVVVVFTLNRLFYPASSVLPVSVLIPYPREILMLWSQTAVRRVFIYM